ncbi:LysR family transcriptional regulator [Hyphomicrobium methylovorum]|uniref:LysR family transcriptional regulator n=1 Tax=Hyphomicrobium methylovorum TaxID=84 RepID=UPI0015E7A5B2|nr:LysR family transcriptional regulator [Hyphomicrobium methylovorum]MBA2127384.1 LysR family transcriptional regulator [Hyphomicrobium methylovorum]
MDRFEAMSVLVAVVEEGSLSAGARKLGTPLATVSRKVSDLEEHLGTKLLIRTSRRVALTDAGRGYLEASKRILEQVGEAERIATGEYSEPRGQLSITAPVVFGRLHVLPIAADFLIAHPKIDLRMYMIDRNVSLIDEHLDVGVRLGHLEDSALIAVRVGTVRRVICASPSYIAHAGMPKVPEDIQNHDGITLQGFSTSPGWRYRGDNDELTAEPRTRVSVNTVEAAIDAASQGLGVVRVLSYQVVEEIKSGALVPLLEAYAPEPIPVQLVYPGKGMLPVKVRAFLDWMTPRLRARLAAAGLG